MSAPGGVVACEVTGGITIVNITINFTNVPCVWKDKDLFCPAFTEPFGQINSRELKNLLDSPGKFMERIFKGLFNLGNENHLCERDTKNYTNKEASIIIPKTLPRLYTQKKTKTKSEGLLCLCLFVLSTVLK